MVLYVAGHVGGVVDGKPRLGCFEFDQQFFVGTIDHMGDDVEAPAMRHPHDDRTHIVVGKHRERFFEHHDHRLEAFG